MYPARDCCIHNTIAGEGLHTLALCLLLTTFGQGGGGSCGTIGLGVIGLIRRTASLRHLLQVSNVTGDLFLTRKYKVYPVYFKNLYVQCHH